MTRKAIALMLLAAACGPSPRPEPAPVPVSDRPVQPEVEAPRPSAPPASRSPVRFAYSPEPHRYRVTQIVTISREPDMATAAQVLTAAAIVTVTARDGGGDIVLTTTVDSGGSFAGTPTQLRWTTSSTDTIRLARTRATPALTCQSDSVSVGLARFYELVSEISTSLVQRDTLTTSACSATIPVLVNGTAVVTADLSAGPALRIARTYTLSGSGVSGQHNVRLTGRGESTAIVSLDPAAGAIVRARETARTYIDVTASGRTTPVVQRTETDVVLLR